MIEARRSPHIFTPFSEKALASSGDTFNTAIYLARAGLPVGQVIRHRGSIVPRTGAAVH
jgi:hypothetical protein